MNLGTIVVIIIGVLVVIGLVAPLLKRKPRRLKTSKFTEEWKEIQEHLKNKADWPDAVVNADHMLDAALRKRKYRGKSMGERLVSAQRKLANNDAVWFAHNLSKKITAGTAGRLKEADVKAALIGFRGALKDIGALEVVSKPAVSPATGEETPEKTAPAKNDPKPTLNPVVKRKPRVKQI